MRMMKTVFSMHMSMLGDQTVIRKAYSYMYMYCTCSSSCTSSQYFTSAYISLAGPIVLWFISHIESSLADLLWNQSMAMESPIHACLSGNERIVVEKWSRMRDLFTDKRN